MSKISQIEDIIAGGSNSLKRASKMLPQAFLANKALVIFRVSTWTGRRTISDEELKAFGITNIDDFKDGRSKGQKHLVSGESLSDIAAVKWRAESFMKRYSHRNVNSDSVFFVEAELLDEVLRTIKNYEVELSNAVEDFILNKYPDEILKGIAKSKLKAPDAPESIFINEYPDGNYIRRAFRITCTVFQTPANAKLSELAEQYRLEKIEESVAEFVEETSQRMRKMLIDCLEKLRTAIQVKEPHAKISVRTVGKALDVFDEFKRVASMIGDKRISELVDACKEKLELQSDWTVEEARAFCIEDYVQAVIDAAADEVLVSRNQDRYLEALSMGLIESPEEEVVESVRETKRSFDIG